MFSEREKKIIKVVGSKPLTFKEISIKVFKDDDNAPFDKIITISNSIRRINDKCAYWNIPWYLEKIKCSGKSITVTKSIL